MRFEKQMGVMVAAGAVSAFLFLSSPAEAAGRIRKRAENQQDRIAQGVKSGELTARETSRIERREARLNREVRHMRKDGELSPRERRRIERQQDALSRGIYRQKHDRQDQ
ncbi:MAG: hypothetical protein ABI592_02010 [Acidobacteriota bacterium]